MRYVPLLPPPIFPSFLSHPLLPLSLGSLISDRFWIPRRPSCHLLGPLTVWIALYWRLLPEQGVLPSTKEDPGLQGSGYIY